MDPSSFLTFATIAQLPKNNFVSIGGGKSYLFSLFTIPSSFAHNSTVILIEPFSKTLLEGNSFNLKQFHEQFLSYGSAPVKYISEAMLAD
jgi:hypothetical protein